MGENCKKDNIITKKISICYDGRKEDCPYALKIEGLNNVMKITYIMCTKEPIIE